MDPTGELTEPTRELADPIFLPTVDPTVDRNQRSHGADCLPHDGLDLSSNHL